MKRTISLGLAAVGLLALVAIGCAVHASGPPDGSEMEPRYSVSAVDFGDVAGHLNALGDDCHYRGHAMLSAEEAQVVVECEPAPTATPVPAPTPTPVITMPSTGSRSPAPTPTPTVLTYPGPSGSTECNIDGEWFPICMADWRPAGCDCHLGK